jgi:hypothetical protein
MEMTERRTHAEFWVVFGILLAVLLIAQLPRTGPLAFERSGNPTSVFSMMGESRRTTEGPFHGANVATVMGGSVLDLRQATIAAGEDVTIDVLAVMGNVVLRVPDGWIVDTKALPIFGGVTDHRGRRARPAEREPVAEDVPRPRIVLHGAILMGGLRITS